MKKRATIKYNNSTVNIKGEGSVSEFFLSIANVLNEIKDDSIHSISLCIDEIKIETTDKTVENEES